LVVRRNAEELGSIGIAKVCAFVADVSGRIDAGASYVRFAWVRDVIRLRHAGRCDRRATRAIAAYRALARGTATLSQAFGIFGGVAYLRFLAHPAILEVDLRVRVTVGLLGRTLPTPAGADGSSEDGFVAPRPAISPAMNVPCP
jgi:hypothetical protein